MRLAAKSCRLMKKLYFLILLNVTCNYLSAQQKIVFKERYLANRVYITHDSTTTDVSLSFSGYKDEVSKLTSRGLTSPSKSSAISNRTLFLTTDSIKVDGSLPLTFRYNIISNAKINNSELPGSKNILNTGDIKAVYANDDRISIISIDGQTPYDQKAALENLLNAQRIKFPETPLKVGDTFSHEVPFEFPMQGMEEKVILKNSYTLTAIKGDNAYFDLDQQISTGIDIENTVNAISLKGNGKGKGKLIFSIKDNCVISNISTLNCTINVNKTGLMIAVDYKITSAQTIEVKSKQFDAPPTVRELPGH
jgi:hypothetical protein